MKQLIASFVAVCCLGVVQGSWYWPFGDDDDGQEEKKELRLSDLMEPASLLIDEASDLAEEGKIDEAVIKYREALKELARVEAENPERVKRPEFATLRTKRAYVNATIDSLLMNQARGNAKVVAVSDTEELERKLAEEKEKKAKAEKEKKAGEKKAAKEKKAGEKKAEKTEEAEEKENEPEKKAEDAKPKKARDLTAKPGSAKALNVEAMKKAEAGEFREAEKLLDQAIKLYPRSYFAYYNMAWLILESNPENTTGAKRYYETGRAMGGKRDRALEEAIK